MRSSLHAKIVTPERALPLRAFGLDLRVLLTTEATGGTISVLTAEHEPGEGPPDHVHYSQDELFFILEGLYEVTVDGRTTTAGPGTIVFIPRNVVHRFKNVGDTTARMLDWSLPGGQDHYFKAISELATGDGFTVEKALEISRKFDTYFPALDRGAGPMAARDLDPATLDVVSPEYYQRNGYPHPEWTWLRHHAPVFWYERPNVEPFWAITKHADIIEISRQPDIFLNAPRVAVFTRELPLLEGEVRHLLNMDPPEHARYRRLASGWFTPRTIRGLDEKVARLTRDVLDAAAENTGGDFVQDVSARITIAVIAEMLGVPRRDWELLLRWTNEVIAPQDPEFQRGHTAEETWERARREVFAYFHELAQRRRVEATDDIVSFIANGQLNGAPLAPVELLSYYFLLVVAGNETTRNAMTGGLLAFLERPDEWQKLRANPALLDTAVEEIVRWTTPVIQFARTATRDYTLRGTTIRKGQAVCLFYASANRDEDVFPDPFAFRIDREPNPHIGFGIGEHFCLGAHLARLELRNAFAQLRDRLEHCELAGPVERARSSFIGGIKHAPMHWEMAGGRGAAATPGV